jgi:hypothetical protein
MDSTIVLLTDTEVALAKKVALQRLNYNIAHGIKHKYGMKDKDGLRYGTVGMLGEFAVAKHFNIPPDTSANGDYRNKDVGGIYQVRTTEFHSGKLIIHNADADCDVFILVIKMSDNRYRLAGWLYGKEAKQNKYWYPLLPGRPAYNVPQTDLRPISSIALLQGGKDEKKHQKLDVRLDKAQGR